MDFPDIEVGPDPSAEEVSKAASLLRQHWGITSGPIPHVVRLLEAGGAIVGRLGTRSSRVDAFSYSTGPRPVVILGSEKKDKARGRFSAAHELGHLVMHHDAEPGDAQVERQANEFASALLMPAEDIFDELPTTADFSAFLELKRVWGVSIQALLFRSRRLGRMTESTYRRAMTEVSANGWRRSEPDHLGPVESPEVLRRAFNLLNERRGVGLAEVAEKTHLPRDVLVELLEDHSL
ncbi:MAG: ImmA/IrrE family metallo-endopeptidase [Actinomycetota bacterium]